MRARFCRPKGTYVSALVPISYIELACSCNPADDPTPVCNCWTDIESCILATFCRSVAFGLNRERAGIGKCCGSCLCYGVLGPILMLVYQFVAVLIAAKTIDPMSTACPETERPCSYYGYATTQYDPYCGSYCGQECQECRDRRENFMLCGFFSSMFPLLLLLSTAEGCNRTKLKLATEGKATDVSCGSATANILAYFGCNVAALFLLFVCLAPELTVDGSYVYRSSYGSSYGYGYGTGRGSNRDTAALVSAISFVLFCCTQCVLAALSAQVRGTRYEYLCDSSLTQRAYPS